MLSDGPWDIYPRHRDFTCGYTALHWACKHGNLDMVKLLAGTYQVTKSRQTHVNSTLKQIPYKYVAGQHWRANTWRLHTSSHRRPAQSSRGFWPVGWCIQGWCQCEGLCWQKTEAVHDGAGISTCWLRFLSLCSYWTHLGGWRFEPEYEQWHFPDFEGQVRMILFVSNIPTINMFC